MQRAGRLLERIATPENILEAYLKARRGKSRRDDVRGFTANLEAEIATLCDDLLAGRCRFDRYRAFRIYDPKERLIHAAPFRDRVLHHAMMNVCEPFFECRQIFDSYACRKGKGTRAALFHARDFARRYPCFLKLDVRRYFPSIRHDILQPMLGRIFKDPHLLNLFDAVLRGAPSGEGIGLPIGNLTSQYFANHFLTPLDQYVKRQLRVPGYVRYMDDFILWGDSTRDLVAWEREARAFCTTQLGLVLKPACINHSTVGVPFLGFVVLPGELRLSSRSCRRARRKYRVCLARLNRGILDQARAATTVRSIFARTDWTNGAALRRRLMADDSGHHPKAGTASTAVAAGPTMPATAVPRTATTGTPTIATTTSGSGLFLPPAQENGRMSSIDPGDAPVPANSSESRDEERPGGRAPVARVDARVEGPRPPFLFEKWDEP